MGCISAFSLVFAGPVFPAAKCATALSQLSLYTGGDSFEFTAPTIQGKAAEFSEIWIELIRRNFEKSADQRKPGQSLWQALGAHGAQMNKDKPLLAAAIRSGCTGIAKPLRVHFEHFKKVVISMKKVSTMADVDDMVADFKMWLDNYRQTINA